MYREFNENPKKKKAADCVVRAITTADKKQPLSRLVKSKEQKNEHNKKNY